MSKTVQLIGGPMHLGVVECKDNQSVFKIAQLAELGDAMSVTVRYDPSRPPNYISHEYTIIPHFGGWLGIHSAIIAQLKNSD